MSRSVLLPHPLGKASLNLSGRDKRAPTSHRDAWLGQGQGARGWLCSSPVTLQRRRDPGGTCPSLPDAQARGLVQSLPALQLGQQPLKRQQKHGPRHCLPQDYHIRLTTTTAALSP